jgi:hypothetical protein
MSNAHNESFPERKEEFEVVLCRKGVSPNSAKPDDFKRVRVSASSSWVARFDEKVAAEAEFLAFTAVKPGIQTQEEILARERELFQTNPPIDRANI